MIMTLCGLDPTSEHVHCTVYTQSLDPIHIVAYYIKWVKTSWTDSIMVLMNMK